MLNAEISTSTLAALAEVDVKSVARWIAEDRIPYPVTRGKVSRALQQEETFLWPSLLNAGHRCAVAAADVERIWPTRSSIPSATWHTFFSMAVDRLDILIYAGGFLIETLDLADVLRWKASTGTNVRVLVGDPDSAAVCSRAEELSLKWLPERCRTTVHYLRQIDNVPGISVLPHATTHYASLFRFGETLLVNVHSFGTWACHSPVLQLRRISSGSVFDFYSDSFDRIWHTSATVYGEPFQINSAAVPRDAESC